jgi:hypothetical protein
VIERSAPPTTLGSQSLDVETMRATAAALLGPDEPLPRFDELAERTDRLRGHLRELLPVVEEAARDLPGGGAEKAAALASVASARRRLKVGPGPGLVSATTYAKSLACEVGDLCRQYEVLTGGTAGGPA